MYNDTVQMNGVNSESNDTHNRKLGWVLFSKNVCGRKVTVPHDVTRTAAEVHIGMHQGPDIRFTGHMVAIAWCINRYEQKTDVNVHVVTDTENLISAPIRDEMETILLFKTLAGAYIATYEENNRSSRSFTYGCHATLSDIVTTIGWGDLAKMLYTELGIPTTITID